MNMKLSYRDKVIFIVVMVILVLVAGFFVFIKPKFEAVDLAKYNLETKQQEKMDIDAKIETLPAIIENLKATATEIGEKQTLFLDEAHPYINETYIREALKDVNVEVTSVTTQYTAANAISRYVVNKKNILAYKNKMDADLYNELPQEVYDQYNKVARESYPGATIGVTSMNLTFESDVALNDAYNVINRIAEDEKAIILNTVSAEAPSANSATERSVTVTITMYSIYPLNVEKVLEETAEVQPIEAAETETETTAE